MSTTHQRLLKCYTKPMKKFLIIGLSVFSMLLLTACTKTQQFSLSGEWVSFSGNKIDLPHGNSAAASKKILEFTASTSDKISFTKDKVKLYGHEFDYKLDKKQKKIATETYTYGYQMQESQDILKFGAEGTSESEWTTYYRVGSKAEKEKQEEIKKEASKDEESVTKLNQTWLEKANQIDTLLKEALVGTWSGYFTSVPTTGLGVAWAPGIETISFDQNSKVSFHASSDDLTNFDSEKMNNSHANYQINGILGLEPSEVIPKDPEKILRIISKLSFEEIFNRIKLITFSYDVTTEAGTISQSLSPMKVVYEDGKLNIDEVLLITQCGDEGVQLSGDISRVE